MTHSKEYALGYSADEDRRLAMQAEILEPLTADLLLRAGISDGMRVLDIGCGVGDVSMLAASLVGPTGSVLGIDRSVESLVMARRRARAAGLMHIDFQNAELSDFQTGLRFDALVGRLILLYLPSPSDTIRRLCGLLENGALVAFQEMDISAAQARPEARLFNRTCEWIRGAFGAAGLSVDMGPRLPRIFIDAGLPRPSMIGGQRIESDANSYSFEYLGATVKSLLPLIKRANVATEAEIDIDTLADRLRAEAIAMDVVGYLPRMVGAWTQRP